MRRGTCSPIAFRSLAKRFFASFVFACILVGTGYTGLIRAQAAATPPRVLMYQGRLLNSNGVPVSDSTASISFALYSASSGGTCLWSNNSPTCASVVARTVALNAGLFSEALGDTAAAVPYSAIATTVFSNNPSVFLEVIVNGETLDPRKAMFSAPYAMNADAVDGYDTTLVGATTSMIPVTDASGNLVITGAPSGTGVSQGSVYINPDGGVVAANEMLLGVAVGGVSRLSVDGEGDGTFLGDLAVNGGDITSTGTLSLDSATGLVAVASSDDFAVGGSSLTAPFSVDESANTVRIGDGTSDANEPSLAFYASNAVDSGSLTYTDADAFAFSGGNVSITGTGVLPTTLSGVANGLSSSAIYAGTSGASLGTIGMYGNNAQVTYFGVEHATGTDHHIAAAINSLTISGVATTLTKGFASRNILSNQSTNGSLLQGSGYLAAVEGDFTQDAAATVLGTGYGVYGSLSAALGTITSATAIFGEVKTGAGTITTGYGGRFLATAAGTNRYGVYAEASGGTANYSGYFALGSVQIDDDATPNVPGAANAAGDLYIADTIEADGSAYFGDTTGADTFQFTSGITTEDGLTITTGSLTTGAAFIATRSVGGADFDGVVAAFNNYNNNLTTDGRVVDIVNAGQGNSVGLYITQSTTSVHGAGTTGNNALVIDIGEAGSADDAIILRSNTSAAADTEFRVTSAGDAFVDGAFTGSGADFAEFFPTTDAGLADREFACQDTSTANAVVRCSSVNRNIVGVVSTNPAFIGNNIADGTEELRGNPKYRLIGLTGQIDAKVTAAEGAIAIGDPVTSSVLIPGVGQKARGPVRIVGFALQPLLTGSGVIRVLVSAQWYGGDVLSATGSATQVAGSLAIAATTAATASSTAVDSAALSLRGSAWSGGSAQTIEMSLQTAVSAVNDYRLSVMNSAGAEVASVGNTGDLAIAGRLYPSDRGASQKSKYIYYDGSSGSGGDFMRTNSAGWATGSYDFAEMFPSPDALTPGEIVVFGDASQQVKRSTGETYSQTIAGIVSTRPGFLAGENRAGNYPIALAGRVPTLVSTENGPINIGDPLTTSTRPGYAMKATEAGPIVGYAAESFAGSAGSVIVYVNVSYYSGAPVAEGPAANNAISQLAQDIENFDIAGTLHFNGGQLLAIGSMTSASGTWRLENDGDFVTSGRLIELVRSAQGADVETYAATSLQKTVQISGTVNLVNGHADVHFADTDPMFISIVDANPTYRALVTPYGATGALYVTNRTVDGFSITESGAASSGVSVDWLVIATRRDYAPTAIPTIPIVSSTPISVIDLGPGSDAAASSDVPEPSSESGSGASDVAPIADTAVVDSIVPNTIVDAPTIPDPGSDTVVSDASATGASVSTEAPSIPDAPVSEPSVPAPSTGSSVGEASP